MKGTPRTLDELFEEYGPERARILKAETRDYIAQKFGVSYMEASESELKVLERLFASIVASPHDSGSYED